MKKAKYMLWLHDMNGFLFLNIRPNGHFYGMAGRLKPEDSPKILHTTGQNLDHLIRNADRFKVVLIGKE